MAHSISWKIKNAAFDFRAKRGDFYTDLASVMEHSPGLAITQILATYADRYKKSSIGVLCNYWLERFHQVGTFAESVRGTVPAEDFAILAASESAGDLRVGLKNLGHNVTKMNKTKREIAKAFVSAIILLVIFHANIGFQSFVLLPKMEAAIAGNVDRSHLGIFGKVLLGGSEFVRQWWWAWFLFMGGLIALTAWAVKNYTGKGREWLDNKILPFQIARDFNSANFFTTLATITAPKSGQIIQLHEALYRVQANSYPWLRWQCQKLMNNLATRPNSKGEIFDTGIADKKNYWAPRITLDFIAIRRPSV